MSIEATIEKNFGSFQLNVSFPAEMKYWPFWAAAAAAKA